jgi:hypothetical protein
VATYCWGAVRGRLMRVTALDECGAPPEEGTPNSMAITKGFVSVDIETDVEDGDEFVVKNADGDLCINDRSPDSIKRLNLTMEFCQVDPGLFSLITGMELELDEAPDLDVAGFRLNEGTVDINFALEVWQGINNAACAAGEGRPHVYNLFPYVRNGILQGYTIENDAASFEITAWTQGGSGWGVGPDSYLVVLDDMGAPSQLFVPVGPTTHLVSRRSAAPLPEPLCGLQPLGGESS